MFNLLKTVFEFVLPQGFVDAQGQVHRQGQMRLATALDEVQSMEDGRVQQNESYLPIVLLSRVIVQLGSLTMITPDVIAQLFASDFAYLEDLYQRLNTPVPIQVNVACPHCNQPFQLQVAPLE